MPLGPGQSRRDVCSKVYGETMARCPGCPSCTSEDACGGVPGPDATPAPAPTPAPQTAAPTTPPPAPRTTPPPAAAAATPADGPPYNCLAGAHAWWVEWTPARQTWCCAQRGIACGDPPYEDAPTTRTAATTAPVSTSPRSLGCDQTCAYQGKRATCRDRIQWTANNDFYMHTSEACSRALYLVLGDCPECSGCSLGASECLPPATTTAPQAAAPPKASAGQRAPQAAAGQRRQGRNGAVGPAAPRFDCSGAALLSDADAVQRIVYCCVHEANGCLNESTPTAAPAVTPRGEAPYNLFIIVTIIIS